MTLEKIFKQGTEFANVDEAAREMLADFKDHKVGMMLGDEELTVVIKDGKVFYECGIRDDCHAVMKMLPADMCSAIDGGIDLMDIREKGEIVKGDRADPELPVHFMSLFPFFDAMVRLYVDNAEFKAHVDRLKASL